MGKSCCTFDLPWVRIRLSQFAKFVTFSSIKYSKIYDLNRVLLGLRYQSFNVPSRSGTKVCWVRLHWEEFLCTYFCSGFVLYSKSSSCDGPSCPPFVEKEKMDKCPMVHRMNGDFVDDLIDSLHHGSV